MTAPGWAPFTATPEDLARSRLQIRAALGIPADGLVVGIVGSLAWTKRVGYSYGLELVQALRRCERADAYALIVGDGDGRIRLEQRAGNDLGKRIILAGRVPREQVPHYLAAMDVASLPQSVDRVGSFRYTTKLSEYLAARLPVITGQIPLAYDLDDGWLWRLAGKAPWDERYIEALANLIDRLTVDEIASKRSALLQKAPDFNRNRQVACVTEFVTDLLAERSGAIAVR
jgi:glycosyltransferase involved in cell wall biosynthesis